MAVPFVVVTKIWTVELLFLWFVSSFSSSNPVTTERERENKKKKNLKTNDKTKFFWIICRPFLFACMYMCVCISKSFQIYTYTKYVRVQMNSVSRLFFPFAFFCSTFVSLVFATGILYSIVHYSVYTVHTVNCTSTSMTYIHSDGHNWRLILTNAHTVCLFVRTFSYHMV